MVKLQVIGHSLRGVVQAARALAPTSGDMADARRYVAGLVAEQVAFL